MITWRGSANSYMQSVAILGSRYGLIDQVYISAMARVAGAPHVEMGVHNSSVLSLRGGVSRKKGANHCSCALTIHEHLTFHERQLDFAPLDSNVCNN